MKWLRKITGASYEKEKVAEEEERPLLRVYVEGCWWGTLQSMDAHGSGYIRFDVGGGSIVRGWDHFFELVSQAEVKDS